jgi:uncharacterized membrane protein
VATLLYECVAAPAAIALALGHATRALGFRRAAFEMLALAAYGFTLEVAAIAVFASHRYGDGWRVAPLGVPLAVAGVWAAVIVAAMAVGWRHGARTPFLRAMTAALAAVSLDTMIEPVAARLGLWEWTPPGPWLDVPIGNFVGWMVIVGAHTWGAERWARGGGASAVARRVALAAGCVAALILVGLAWTALGLERVFAGGRGWMAWGAILAAALSTRRWPRLAPATPPPSLPESLAATPGRLPEAVFLVVGIAFLIGAYEVGDLELIAVAVVTLLAVRTVASVRREHDPGQPTSDSAT